MDSVKNSFKPATHNQNQTAKPAPPPLCLEDSFFRGSARVKKVSKHHRCPQQGILGEDIMVGLLSFSGSRKQISFRG